MTGAEGERLAQLAPPRLDRLSGPPADEIEVHSGKAGKRRFDRPSRLRRIVQATEKAQGEIVEGLHAERDPIDPR